MITEYDFKVDKKIIYNDKTSILLELVRYNLVYKTILNIDKFFAQNHIKCYANRLISVWIMNNISKHDPIIPYNATNNTQLKRDIKYFASMSNCTENIDNIMDKLDIVKKFNKIYDELQYIKNNQTNIYDILKIKKAVTDKVTLSLVLDDNYLFFKDYYLFNRFVELPTKVYDKLYSHYLNKDKELMNNLIFIICLRYKTLNSGNMQLANDPILFKKLYDKCNIDFELFASSLNFYSNNYCSLFYDVERYFGSKGNFNNIKLIEGEYVANPPFDNNIMENMCKKLVKSIKEANKKNLILSFFISIPNWKTTIEYGEFKCRKILENSKLITFNLVLPKEKTRFYDHYLNKYISPGEMWYIVIQSELAKKNSKLVETLSKYFN